MRGQRRDPRFALSAPLEGWLRVPDDVLIERFEAGEVWVVSSSPAGSGELLTLDVSGPGAPATMSVRVVECIPVVVDGVVRHGLRLAVVS